MIESLSRLIHEADGALIIATPDDLTTRRGESVYTPATNVLLEYGLFCGSLGRAQVGIVSVGSPVLPSDLDGVLYLRLKKRKEHQNQDVYESVEIEPLIVPWLRNLDAASSDAARISNLLTRLAPQVRQKDRIKLKSRILCDRIDPRAFSKLPEQELLEILGKYSLSYREDEEVGHVVKTPVASYLDLTRVGSDSPDQRKLAGHLARYVAELVSSKEMRPTTIAISKVAATGVLNATADLLPFPKIYVSPYGPNRDNPVEGFYESGDRAILLHDVALSGHHLIDCIAALRSTGISAGHLVVLAEYGVRNEPLESLLAENGITMHAAARFTPNAAVLPGISAVRHPAILPTPAVDETVQQCLLCDVVTDADARPFRSLFSPSELPSEFLLKTDRFSVVADVAPLARGHVLVVSDVHVASMADLPSESLEKLGAIRRFVTSVFRAEYGSGSIAFEHGLCDPTLKSACGIDHAHLHVLPTDMSITDAFRSVFDCRGISSLSQLPGANSGSQEYLLLIDQQEKHYLATVEEPTSQFFRKVISDGMGEILWRWSDKFLLGDRNETRRRILEVHRIFADIQAGRSEIRIPDDLAAEESR